MDSYQEDDLNSLRRKWGDALQKRKEYLDGQITKYLSKHTKSEAEIEREQSLVEQVRITTDQFFVVKIAFRFLKVKKNQIAAEARPVKGCPN